MNRYRISSGIGSFSCVQSSLILLCDLAQLRSPRKNKMSCFSGWSQSASELFITARPRSSLCPATGEPDCRTRTHNTPHFCANRQQRGTSDAHCAKILENDHPPILTSTTDQTHRSPRRDSNDIILHLTDTAHRKTNRAVDKRSPLLFEDKVKWCAGRDAL